MSSPTERSPRPAWEQRNQQEIYGVLFLSVAAIFLAETRSPEGKLGSFVGEFSELIGYGTVYLSFLLSLFGIRCLMHRKVLSSLSEAIGWLALFPLTLAFLDQTGRGLGGRVGFWASSYLAVLAGTFASKIFLLSFGFLALCLALRSSPLEVASLLLRTTRWALEAPTKALVTSVTFVLGGLQKMVYLALKDLWIIIQVLSQGKTVQEGAQEASEAMAQVGIEFEAPLVGPTLDPSPREDVAVSSKSAPEESRALPDDPVLEPSEALPTEAPALPAPAAKASLEIVRSGPLPREVTPSPTPMPTLPARRGLFGRSLNLIPTHDLLYPGPRTASASAAAGTPSSFGSLIEHPRVERVLSLRREYSELRQHRHQRRGGPREVDSKEMSWVGASKGRVFPEFLEETSAPSEPLEVHPAEAVPADAIVDEATLSEDEFLDRGSQGELASEELDRRWEEDLEVLTTPKEAAPSKVEATEAEVPDEAEAPLRLSSQEVPTQKDSGESLPVSRALARSFSPALRDPRSSSDSKSDATASEATASEVSTSKAPVSKAPVSKISVSKVLASESRVAPAVAPELDPEVPPQDEEAVSGLEVPAPSGKESPSLSLEPTKPLTSPEPTKVPEPIASQSTEETSPSPEVTGATASKEPTRSPEPSVRTTASAPGIPVTAAPALKILSQPSEAQEASSSSEEVGLVVERPLDLRPSQKEIMDEAERQQREEAERRRAQLDAYEYPPIRVYNPPPEDLPRESDEELQRKADLIVTTLGHFGIQSQITRVTCGPTITQFELVPAAGVKISKITSLADDLAMALEVGRIRIEAPIPGRGAVGLEVPNTTALPVFIKEMVAQKGFRASEDPLTYVLGKSIDGTPIQADLHKAPHMLVAGATGAGKSVCMNSIICSLLMKNSPEELKFILIDPKMVEMMIYDGIAHLVTPVITDPKAASAALQWAVLEMERRYKLLSKAGYRNISGFNKAVREGKVTSNQVGMPSNDSRFGPLPYMVIVIDELADLMMVAAKDIEESICRLAQMARAVGMHLIVATQRPSTNVITGIIKANLPTRIAFRVASKIDSKVILDHQGAEALLGRGDMLYLPVGRPKPLRLQGAFVEEDEVKRLVAHIKAQVESDYEDIVAQVQEENAPKAGAEDYQDEYMVPAICFAVDKGEVSTSLLQRQFKIGYNRAACIVDAMEAKGWVSGAENGRRRKVLLTSSELDAALEGLR